MLSLRQLSLSDVRKRKYGRERWEEGGESERREQAYAQEITL